MAVVIGLTGGIAMGKSTISDFLKSKKIPVIDADKIAHEILNDQKMISKLVGLFSDVILNDGGMIDRKKLGKIVFSDAKELEKLNQAVQPVIRAEILRQIGQFDVNQPVFLDAPLLFEQGYETIVNFIMVVATSQEKQLKRLMDRDLISEAEAKSRIDAQMSIEEKQKRADIVIDTGGTIEETRDQVVKWLVNSNLFKDAEKFSEVK